MQDGRIGGRVFLFNPNGILIGQEGVVNVGSLVLATPTTDFMNRLVTADGEIGVGELQQTLAGHIPLTPTGLIQVKGTINAKEEISLQGGEVQLGATGRLNAGAGIRAALRDVVNIEGLESAAGIEVHQGVVRITAVGDVMLAGGIDVDGQAGQNAGRIEVRADQDIDVKATASVSASGRGEDSAGGNILIRAERDALIASGASIRATGGTSGDAGSVEFSGIQTVYMSGSPFDVSATAGRFGSVLIDPKEFIWQGEGQDVFHVGNYTLEAEERIILDNVMISTRQVAGGNTRDNHLHGSSIGDSGDITIRAPRIELKNGAMLLAHADGPHQAGAITLDAQARQPLPIFGSLQNTQTFISVSNSTIRGGDITIESVADDTFEWTGVGAADVVLKYLNNLALFVDASFSVAQSDVFVGAGSWLQSSGDISISSKSNAEATMKVLSTVFGFGYGDAQSTANATISQATIQAAGDVRLYAEGKAKVDVGVATDNNQVFSQLTAGASKYVDVAIAYATAEINAHALIGSLADVTAGGQVTVEAKGDKRNSVSASGGANQDGTAAAGVALSFFETDISAAIEGTVIANDIQVLADLSSTLNTMNAKSSSGVGLAGYYVKKIDPRETLLDKISAFVQGSGSPQVNNKAQPGQQLGLSASFGYMNHVNSVTAYVGTDADLTATGDVKVHAHIRDNMSYRAAAATDPFRLNNAQQDREPKKVALSAAVAVVSLSNHAQAYVDGTISADGSIHIHADSEVPIPGTEWGRWDSPELQEWTDYVKRVKTLLDSGTFSTINGWTQSFAESEKFSLSGSFNVLKIDNSAEAYLGSTARINPGAGPAAAAQDVTIEATAHQGVINFAGVFGYNPLNLFTGSQSGGVGVGGSYQDLTFSGGARAWVEDGAVLRGDELHVAGHSRHNIITIGESGTKASQVAINGVFSWVKGDIDTMALVSPGAHITGRLLAIDGLDNTTVVNTAGGLTTSSNVGIGAAVALTEIDRSTRAMIANLPGQQGSGGSIQLSQNLLVQAVNEGFVGGFSLSATIPAVGKGNQEEGTTDTGGSGKAGFGLSADISFNTVNNLTEALIFGNTEITVSGSTVVLSGRVDSDQNIALAPGVKVSAIDESELYALAGAITIQTEDGSMGLAGAYSHNTLDKTTRAGVAAATLIINNGGGLNITAVTEGELISIAAGGAGAQKVGVAGSVGYSTIGNTTEATLLSANVTMTGGAVNVKARDESDIRAIAGAGSYGGKAGIGAAASANFITNTTRASLDGGQITDAGSILAEAHNENQLVSASAAIAGSQTAAISGSLAFNEIENTTEALLLNGSFDSTGLIHADAADESEIITVTGGIAVSTGKAAVGVAGAYNNISNTTKAMAANVLLEGQTIQLSSRQEADILAIGVGGGGAAKVGVTGSLAVNNISNTTESLVLGSSDFTSTQNTVIEARDDSTIQAITGAAAGAGTAAIGASGSYNNIDNTVRAQVTSATLNSGQSIDVRARRSDELFVIAAGGAGAGTAGFAGSVAINNIGGETEALVNGGASLTAQDHLQVYARSDSEIFSVAGSLAIGGTVGIGGAVAVNDVDQQTLAEVSGVGTTLTAHGKSGTMQVESGQLQGGSSDLADQRIFDPMRGTAVIASSTNDVQSVIANLSGGGKVGVAAIVGVTMLDGSTQAMVRDGATLALDSTQAHAQQEARVGAFHHARVNNGAGGLAIGGAAGVGGGADAGLLSHQTRAEVRGADVTANHRLRIDAQSSTELQTVVTGAGLAGAAGISGSIGVVDISGSTLAIADNAGLTSYGDLWITADNEVESTVIIGSVGIGGGVGIGASVGVVMVDHTTGAYTQGASTLNSRRQTLVEAASSHDLTSYGATLSGAGGFSLAGTVVVTVLEGQTYAQIGGLTDVNQDLSFAGPSQSVTVQATDHSEVSAMLGGLAVDLFGVGAGATVDVALVNLGVSAGIGDGARVRSSGEINVEAESVRQIESLTIAAAGGVTSGMSGAVSVVNVGSRPDADADSQIRQSVSFADGFASGDSFADNLDTDADSAAGTRDRARARQGQVGLQGAYETAPSADGYSARAFIGDQAVIHAGTDVNVSATNRTEVDLTAAAAAIGGALGLGGGAAIANIDDRVLATVGGEIHAAGLNVHALDHQDQWSNVKAYAGGGGVVGLGAAVAIIDHSSTVGAGIADDAFIRITGDVVVSADQDTRLKAETVQLSVGLAAVGASVSRTEASGGALVDIGRRADVDGRDISVTSTVEARQDARAAGATGGVLAGTGTDSRIKDRTSSEVVIGQDAVLRASRNLDIEAQASPRAYALAQGAAVSIGASVGVSITEVDLAPTVRAVTRDGAELWADQLTVSATLGQQGSARHAEADSRAAVGGYLLGVGATEAKVNVAPISEVLIGNANVLDADQSITLFASGSAVGRALVNGKSFGLLAGGGNVAETRTNNRTFARLGAGSNVRTDGLFRFYTLSDSDLYAQSTSGSGGLGAVVVSLASTDSRATTTTEILSGPSTRIEAGRVEMEADHVTTFNTKSDSFAASIAGYSGGRANNSTDLNTTAHVGNQAAIEAEQIDIKAMTRTLKPELAGGAYNLRSGSGGALDVAAGRTQTTLRHTTRVEIGSDASLIASRPGDDQGLVNLHASNRIDVRDSVNLDSGGAIAIARTESLIDITRGQAEIIIGERASLQSDGDIRLGTQTIADVRTEAYSKTYGAAGAAQGRTRSNIKADQLIHVRADAELFAEESIYLNNGTGPSANRLNADAETRLWNRTAFPIETDPDARGEVSQNNRIWVDDGAGLLAVRDVNVLAGTGSVTTRGYGRGTDLYREVAEATANFFGGIVGADPVSLDIKGGSTANSSVSSLRIDGTLNAGVRHHQFIVIPRTGPITEISDGVSYRYADQVELTTLLQTRIDELRNLAETYDDFSVAREAFLLEISFLEQKLAEFGGSSVNVDFVVVEDATARTGNVRLGGLLVAGSGHLIAPGDARIDITNHSQRFLETMRLTIPDDEGGQILLNGVRVGSNADINQRTVGGTILQLAQFQTILNNETSPLPQITITNTYDPDTPGNNPNVRAPEVFVSGDITNIRGNVLIRSIGSVNSAADIVGQTIDIFTAGDLFQGFTWGFNHLGGDPVAQLGNIPTNNVLLRRNETRSDLPTATGSRIVGNNVFISAERLNINGLIQSGLPDRSVVITPEMVQDVGNFRSQYLAESAAWLPGMPEPQQFFSLNNPDINDPEIRVVYNAGEDRLELNGVRVRGGHMELFGDIFSTGNGTLNVLDGYGRINVTNQTTMDLVVNRLDSGIGIEGMIRLTDTSQFGADGRFLVTEITRNQNTAFVRNSAVIDAEGNPAFIVSQTDGRSTVFQPQEGRRFNWISGRNTDVDERRIFTSRSALGLDWLVPDYNNPDERTTTSVFIDRIQGDFLSFSNDTSNYRHQYTRIETTPRYMGEDREIKDYIVYKEVKVTAFYQWEIFEFFHHSLNASRPVNVNFIGYDSGELNIDSQGRLLIAGLVRNPLGTTQLNGTAILPIGDMGLIIADQLVLDAGNGAIGHPGNPLLIDIQPGGDVDALAQQGIHLRNISGDLPIRRIHADEGSVSLESDRDIRSIGAVQDPIRSRDLTLISRNGAIGSLQQPLNVVMHGDRTTLTARAANDIGIRTQAGDLRIHTVESLGGDVMLEATQGSLLDFNPNEVRDERTEQELRNLWSRARLIGDEAIEGKAFTTEAFGDKITAKYFDYWRMRNVRAIFDVDGQIVGYQADAYSPDFVVSLSDTQAEALRQANGWGDQELAAFAQQETERFHEAHARFASLGDFDPNFRHVVTADEAAVLTEGAVWTETQLQSAISAALFKDVTRTRTQIEDPNVVGREITLIAAEQIGTTAADVVIPRGVPASTWTDEQQLALAAAERADVTLTDTEIRIRINDDVNLQASGFVRLDAERFILVGSESDLLLDTVRTNGAVRIKTAGDILSSGAPANILGADTILEASSGRIGTIELPLTMMLLDQSTFTARSSLGMTVHETSGNLLIDAVYSPDQVRFIAEGSILDGNADAATNILARGVDLFAGQSIGLSPDPVGAVNIELLGDTGVNAAAGGSISLSSGERTLTAGDMTGGAIYLLGSRNGIQVAGTLDSGGTVELFSLGSVNVLSSASIDAVDEIFVQAPDRIQIGGRLSAGSIELLGAQSGMQVTGVLDSVGTTDLLSLGSIDLTGSAMIESGAAVVIASGLGGTGGLLLDNQAHVRSLGGTVTLSARDDLFIRGDARVSAGQAATISAGESGVGSILMNGRGRVDAGNAKIAMAASDDVVLAQLRTRNTASDAVTVTALQGSISGVSSITPNIDAPLGGVVLTAARSLGDAGQLTVVSQTVGSLVSSPAPNGLVNGSSTSLPPMPQTPGMVDFGRLLLGRGGSFGAGVIRADIVNTSNPNSLVLNVANHAGQQAEWALLSVASNTPVIFEQFLARAGRAATDAPEVTVLNGRTDLFNEVSSRDHQVRVDRVNRLPISGIDVSLFTLDGNYRLQIQNGNVNTNAFVLRYNPNLLINGVFSTENSADRVLDKNLGSMRRQTRQNQTDPWLPFIIGPAWLFADESVIPGGDIAPVNTGDALDDPESVDILEP